MENLNLDQNGRPRWTVKSILIGRTSGVISSVILFDFLFGIIALVLMLLPLPNILYAIFGWLFPPAIVVSAIFWQIRLANRRLDQLPPEAAVHFYKMECRFKWHPLFGVVIFAAVWWVVMLILSIFVNINRWSGSMFFAVMAGSIAAACIAAKLFNRFMIRKTQTNVQLLDEMEQGLHWEKIPEEYFNEQAVKKIVKKLVKCQAYTVEDAVAIYKRDLMIKKAGKIYGIVLLVTAVITWIIGEAVDRAVDREIKAFADQFEYDRKKEEEEAADYTEGDDSMWRYNDAKKTAYAELDWAKKGAAVNPNSSYTQERLNSARHWANEARNIRGW